MELGPQLWQQVSLLTRHLTANIPLPKEEAYLKNDRVPVTSLLLFILSRLATQKTCASEMPTGRHMSVTIPSDRTLFRGGLSQGVSDTVTSEHSFTQL